ncbi:DUF4143 domain-containing protein [Bdellovibrionota bacterium FG-2]
MEYKRLLELRQILKRKSAFFFGPRATGKSWWIKRELGNALVFDLLDSDVYSRFLRRPRQLGEECLDADLVVIDEIQKLPALLDEVHRLIEKDKAKRFLLTGSSARKLRQQGVNLLGGRASNKLFFPLTSLEISDFDLVKYVNIGGLPSIYLSDDPETDLKDYVQTYLKEEIQAEALVRRIDHFARFLDTIGLSSGQELNIAQVASDAGVPPRTVASFIEVMKDTLIAFELEPFCRTKTRKASTKSKIFLFDVGIANFLSGRRTLVPKSEAFGAAFEHFIIQEIRALLSYQGSDESLSYWRAKDHEVDLIIGNRLAIEIKSTEHINERHIKGLRALREEKLIERYIIVSRDPIRRTIDGIEAWPYAAFLKSLFT